MPCSLTPVGLLAPGPYSAGVLSPLWHYQDNPDDMCLSWLYRTAFGLAVYASQAPLREHHPRKTRFRLVANLCWAGFTCRVPYERFPLCRLTSTLLPPFPGLTWRTEPGTSPGALERMPGLANRVDPASCPAGPPTDPDVRISRIRLFEAQLRYATQMAWTIRGRRSG